MTKTINSYVPDRGDLDITITAADVTAITAFVTAELISLSGVLRSFKRAQTPERSITETRVTGDTTPIVTPGDVVGSEMWDMIIVDDYSKGDAGEWGTDNLAALEIFQEFFDARRAIEGGLAITPAGSSTGMIQTTLTAPVHVVSITHPDTDADQTKPNEITIRLACSDSTKAAHA